MKINNLKDKIKVFCLDQDDLIAILPTCAILQKTVSNTLQMINDACADKDPGNLFMRIYFILTALGQHELALQMQSNALGYRALYRVASPLEPKIRLLTIMGPGDMTDNVPIDFLVERSDIRVDLLFISSENTIPLSIPDHDIAFVALGESENNNPILEKISTLLYSWPRPYLNHPEKILNCARHRTSQILQNIPGLLVPKTIRAGRGHLGKYVYPLTIRPIDTHSGKGFEKINNSNELNRYLNRSQDDEFYISEFVEYRSEDGNYRKLRIALIDRKPFICHLAISENWIVHYHSSGMEVDEYKRTEEREVMENFDDDFVARHGDALNAIAERLDLDYVVIDCAEIRNGDLLLFEADPRGWVHATDPIEVFPYKPAMMQKVFDAFRSLLLKKSLSGKDA